MKPLLKVARKEYGKNTALQRAYQAYQEHGEALAKHVGDDGASLCQSGGTAAESGAVVSGLCGPVAGMRRGKAAPRGNDWPGAEPLCATLGHLAYAMQKTGARGTAVGGTWATDRLTPKKGVSRKGSGPCVPR